MLKDAGKPSTIETSIAKLYATESAVECANAAIQVHGGSGYVDDYPVERYLRDARVTTLYEGTSQIQKLIIGRDATGINAMTAARGRERELAPRSRRSVDGHVGAAAGSNRPEARNALSPELMEELGRRGRAARRRRRGALHRDRRLATRSSPPAPTSARCASASFHEALFHPAAGVLEAARAHAGRR